ncbi:unnamed protein product [Aspergillus oryzae]|uniref:Unnamed protein product n=2 Tax=Aspergillus oryzae TaxID=5062 RepID=A0AAN4YGK3_ASPOZ|nr:unnamed protein product [Aspergillus oryzae]GMF84910.1 unnamed protein product [Aspergillus oryzae]GMG09340.1 unnamed protein product [Aspergillus oryzae]GMG28650.1 unnamed protein product [Aspergillus oryzae]GMG43556.1 unnamed protein product [Aspergillus oryzae var. brunneus]
MASKTWFDGLKRSFADVPVGADNSISTTEFLEASESLTTLFDRQLAAPAESETVQSLSVNELKTKKHTASEGLLWLVRYELIVALTPLSGVETSPLMGVSTLRRHVDKTGEELASSFREAYGVTLSKHHNFIVKKVFSVAVGAAPNNKNFYKSLASSTDDVSAETEAKIQEQLTREVKALEKIVSILQKFQEQPDAKW